MAKADLSADRLRELLDYNPDTGVFTWRVKRRPCHLPGDLAGHIQIGKWGQKRWLVGIDGKSYKAHRLAWLHMTGSWPKNEIDHINGDSLDNKFSNLRDVDRKTNMENIRKPMSTSKTGVLGVFFNKRVGCYVARVSHNDKAAHCSYHKTLHEAQEAYISAKRRLHEGCTI